MGIAEIKSELQDEFPTLAQQDGGRWLDGCAAVGALLEEGAKSNQVKAALESLDKRMFELIRQRIDAVAFKGAESAKEFQGQSPDKVHRTVVGGLVNQGGGFQPKANAQKQKVLDQLSPFTQGENPFRKVLVTVLAADEADCAYPANQDVNFHPRYYTGLVGREPFLDTIASGQHWKDVGASPLHGEYTHRLQWFVVAHSGVVPRNTVGELYRFIGQFKTQSRVADRLGQADLWPRLCDRPRADTGVGKPGNAVNADDFRAPEHFTQFMLKTKDYPILSAFISARYGKRLKGLGNDTDFPGPVSMQDYTARKLFGGSMKDLDDNEAEAVRGLTSGVVNSGAPNWFDKRL